MLAKEAADCGEEHAGLARGLAALAHPRRIEILLYLSSRSACCCKDVVERVELAQSTVSQHLKVLVDAGLVRCRSEGQRSRYAVDAEALGALTRGVVELNRACGTCRG